MSEDKKSYEELEKEFEELKEFMMGLTSITLPMRIPGVSTELKLECLVSHKAADQIKQISTSMAKFKADQDKENIPDSLDDDGGQ